MKKYIYYISLILLLLVPVSAVAQDRPNAKQNKNKPRVYANTQGGQIKHNKLENKFKTSDPEYSGVRTEPYGAKKTKKVNNDTVDVADDIESKNANQ